jgi:hypothetical protein
VVNGTVLDNKAVPGLYARPAPQKAARGRERDFLFCHLTLTGPADETADLAEELADELGKRFFAAPGSVTSVLRRAVIETNEQLLRQNLKTKTPREGALSCAVLHGDELYTLQVGEGLAFLGYNFGVERLPVQRPQHLTPLGRSAGIDVRFAYHQLQSGDMLLMADPRLSHLTGASLSSALVDTDIESGLESLIEIVAGDTARLLLVEFADELPSTLPLTFQHSKKPAAKSNPSERAAIPAPPKSISPPRRAFAGGEAAPVSPPAAVTTVAPTIPEGPATAEMNARRVMSTSVRGLSRAIAWLADVLGRLGGSDRLDPPIHWAIPSTVALIIPIVVAAVITSVYIQRGTVEELSVIKQRMTDEMLLAEGAGGNPAEAQGHYNNVLQLATDAEELRLNDPDVIRIRTQALDALDQLDGVNRLSATTFYRYESDADLIRIAIRAADGGIAVLDRVGNRILFHPTDEILGDAPSDEPSILAYGDQPVGSQVIGRLFDLIWQPGSVSATRDAIIMLDSAGGLFNYHPNFGDISGIMLGNSSAWVDPAAIATYLDRLYVLDRGAGQIWKYYASSNYEQLADDETIFFGSEAGLDQAVDFDLFSEDGSMVIVYQDGRMRYYDTRSGRVQWDETALQQRGLTSPLISPSAVKLVGSGLNASIYVLDPGSGRLIQLSRGGTVLTQIRVLDETGNEVLSRASDFAVLESPFRLFVVAGNSIYRAER